jgi:hypothetical protein
MRTPPAYSGSSMPIYFPSQILLCLSACGYRSDMRTKLLEIADTMPLAPMAALREKKVRAFVKETVGNLLTNQRPN